MEARSARANVDQEGVVCNEQLGILSQMYSPFSLVTGMLGLRDVQSALSRPYGPSRAGELVEGAWRGKASTMGQAATQAASATHK